MDDHPRLESEAEALARFRAAFGTPEEMFALGLASVCAIMDAEERGETTASPSEFLARHPEVVPVIARKAREAAAEFHARPVPVRPPIRAPDDSLRSPPASCQESPKGRPGAPEDRHRRRRPRT